MDGWMDGRYSFTVLPALYPFSWYGNLDIGITVSVWYYY